MLIIVLKGRVNILIISSMLIIVLKGRVNILTRGRARVSRVEVTRLYLVRQSSALGSERCRGRVLALFEDVCSCSWFERSLWCLLDSWGDCCCPWLDSGHCFVWLTR